MSTFTKIRDAFLAFLEGPVWDFIHPFLIALEAGGTQILLTAAENAVVSGFAAGGDGHAKMAAALDAFKAEVSGKGIPFIESQARTLIELALQKAKAANPAPAA